MVWYLTKHPKKPGQPKYAAPVDPHKVPSENDSERERGLQGDGSLERRRKRAKAEIGPMTTNRKSDRIGRLGLGDFFNATPIFELFV